MTFWTIAERIVIIAWIVFFTFLIVYFIACLFAAFKTRKVEEENGAVEKEESPEEPTKEAYDHLCNDYDLLERQYEELLAVCATASVMRDVYKSKLERVKQENEHLQKDKEIYLAALKAKTDG